MDGNNQLPRLVQFRLAPPLARAASQRAAGMLRLKRRLRGGNLPSFARFERVGQQRRKSLCESQSSPSWLLLEPRSSRKRTPSNRQRPARKCSLTRRCRARLIKVSRPATPATPDLWRTRKSRGQLPILPVSQRSRQLERAALPANPVSAPGHRAKFRAAPPASTAAGSSRLPASKGLALKIHPLSGRLGASALAVPRCLRLDDFGSRINPCSRSRSTGFG
jgi:hypothetical protein